MASIRTTAEKMYPQSYPNNRWYVGARSEEVGRKLFRRWLLDEPVVFYRTEAGEPVALVDQCVHRQYPLSKSRLLGDTIECGYHGLTYDSAGVCVRIPGQDYINPRVRVKSYPVIEKPPFVWVWPGELELVDESLIPDHHWTNDSGWVTVGGLLHMNARAQLLNENLLDLSHVTFLHPTSIGTEKVAEVPVETEVEGNVVRVSRIMKGIESPPLFAKVMGLEGLIDRTQIAEFQAPCFHITHVKAEVAEGGRSQVQDVCEHKVFHCITPERSKSAHYFWAFSRNYALDERWVSDTLRAGITNVFLEDIDACEEIETTLSAYEPDYPIELNIAVDGGPNQARRLVKRMVEAESREAS